MRVQCEDCKKWYNDEYCWTICPHNSLEVGPTAILCRRHDLYNCYLCHKEKLDYQEILGEYHDPRELEIRELQKWKGEAMRLEMQWDPQELARMLGGTPRKSCRRIIQKEIPKLLQRCNNFQTQLEEIRTTLNIPSTHTHEEAIEDIKAIYRGYYNA